ncbi:MAG: SIMPL domain-containing protein [Candidatus Sabulitectum sp.]|nr:SIMPL domain-containing protein [Candidatus Sabulitectum sp.]
MRVLLAASAIALLLTGCEGGGSVGGIAQGYQPYPPSVTATGVGTATGVADMAVINFSVNISNIDAGVAVNEATELAEGAIEAAVEIGISEDDIETVGYSLYMEEEYDYDTYEYTGENIYHLTHSFSVKVRDIDQAGDVLAALVSGGATTVMGIQFTVSNRDELISEARDLAVINARETAEQLAEGLGVSLGDPMNISEWIDYYGDYDSYGYGGYADDYYYDSPPISPGNTSVSINVSVTYAID